MYWLILMGALGQVPDVPVLRTMAEVRESLNRFDDISKIALESKARQEAATYKPMTNEQRRKVVETRLKTFAIVALDIGPPWQDAESSLIENLSDSACKPYDYTSNLNTQLPALPTVKTAQPVLKGWQNTVNGQVWGWKDEATGYVYYYQQEQPVAPKTLRCNASGCRYE